MLESGNQIYDSFSENDEDECIRERSLNRKNNGFVNLEYFLFRPHLKKVKWPDLDASCSSAENGFQQNCLDEFPTGGRKFITALCLP